MAKTGHIKQKEAIYWNNYYQKEQIEEESTFCTFVKGQIDTDSIILDVGCGSGRDAFSFAKEGYEVVGIDRSEEAIKVNNARKEKEEHKGAKIRFHVVDLFDKETLDNILSSVCSEAVFQNKKLVIYMRFLLHSINEETEEILLTSIGNHLPKGGYIAAEFRTIEDKELHKVYDNHYRRFINAEELVKKLEYMYDFQRISFIKSRGLSVYKSEDPFLARILMKKG